MRLLDLARAALEAEGLHLRRQARARGIQAALAVAAVIFLLLLLGMLHLAGFAALAPLQTPISNPGAGWCTKERRAGDDRLGTEARAVRQQAVRQIGDGAARALVLAPALRGGGLKKSLLGAALTALVLGLIARR